MTEPTEVERALRAVLRERVGTLAPPVEPYEAVTHRRRRGQRRAVLAAAVAVAVTAVGVPVGLRAVGADPTDPVATAARPVNGVRGSLAGDRRLLAEATQVAREYLAADVDRKPPVPPSSLRPAYAEQRDGRVLVLVRESAQAGRLGAYAWVGRGPSEGRLHGLAKGTYRAIRPAGQDLRARDGREYADPMWVAEAIPVAGAEFGVVIVPPDARVLLRSHTVLAADCSLGGQEQLALSDGTAMFRLQPGTSPRVEAFDRAGNRVVLDRPVPHGGGNDGPLLPAPTTAELTELLRPVADDVPPRMVDQGFTDLRLRAALVENPKEAYLVRWVGRMPGTAEPMALVGVRLEGGATALSLRLGRETNHSAFAGCLPTADLSRRVIAGRMGGPGDDRSPLLVVAPPQAVRAEVVFRTGTMVPIQLTAGGGVLTRAGEVRTVRAYDAGGRLLDERAPELPPLPGGYI